jgi:hypothetical protein
VIAFSRYQRISQLVVHDGIPRNNLTGLPEVLDRFLKVLELIVGLSQIGKYFRISRI